MSNTATTLAGIRELPDPVQWHEGMLLSPQHFQQEALRQHATSALHVRLVSPFHWGVVHLLLDRSSLVTGLIRVLELEAVMPDGLIVWHDSTCPEPLELNISDLADPLAQTPFTIHLTVPTARSGTAGGSLRWLSIEGKPVADENGGEEIAIPRLRPRLGLMVTRMPGEKPPQRVVSLPLTRLVFANDAFALADYAPPTLKVVANSTIGRLCSDLARRLREKAMLLAERGEGDNVELRSLVAALPMLEAQLAVEACHPFGLYLAVCAIVGQVASFASSGVPPKLSRYNHDDGLAAFAEARDYIVKMVERVREVAVPIQFTLQDGIFGLDMEEAWLRQSRLVIGVRGAASMSTAEIVAWIENAVIGSRSKLEHLASLRVKGASRSLVENAVELGVSPQRGTALFAIECDPNLILAGERLEIWNPDNLGGRSRPADIALFVLS